MGHANLCKAIRVSNEHRACVFMAELDGAISLLSACLRVLLQKFRSIKKDDKLREVSAKKASRVEKSTSDVQEGVKKAMQT